MKYELKDIIHLYLGCEVFVTNINKVGRLYSSTLNNDIEITFEDQKGWYITDLEETRIKLLLRPLSSMTEEEALCIYRLTNTEDVEAKATDVLSYYKRAFRFEPEEFLELIKMDFDLFELIKQGQAIDKTTL